MLTLLQVINRMIYLEYEPSEIRTFLGAIQKGHMSVETAFTVLGLEAPVKTKLDLFAETLKHQNKVDAALNISFLRAEA